jgi:hypothetical protein
MQEQAECLFAHKMAQLENFLDHWICGDNWILLKTEQAKYLSAQFIFSLDLYFGQVFGF